MAMLPSWQSCCYHEDATGKSLKKDMIQKTISLWDIDCKPRTAIQQNLLFWRPAERSGILHPVGYDCFDLTAKHGSWKLNFSRQGERLLAPYPAVLGALYSLNSPSKKFRIRKGSPKILRYQVNTNGENCGRRSLKKGDDSGILTNRRTPKNSPSFNVHLSNNNCA